MLMLMVMLMLMLMCYHRLRCRCSSKIISSPRMVLGYVLLLKESINKYEMFYFYVADDTSSYWRKTITSHILTTTMLTRNIQVITMAMYNIFLTVRSMSMTGTYLQNRRPSGGCKLTFLRTEGSGKCFDAHKEHFDESNGQKRWQGVETGRWLSFWQAKKECHKENLKS